MYGGYNECRESCAIHNSISLIRSPEIRKEGESDEHDPSLPPFLHTPIRQFDRRPMLADEGQLGIGPCRTDQDLDDGLPCVSSNLAERCCR